MSDHPHVYLRGHMVPMGHEIERVCDRCALTESQSRDCPVAMREEIGALRNAVPRWRRVETEPPTEAAFVLARWGHGLPEVTNWTGAYWRTLDIDVETPTYWMPLPAPPSKGHDV